MSCTVIHGLRFRRVKLRYEARARAHVQCEAKKDERCDALICLRCTAVLRDAPEAERHLCLSFYWLMGVTLDEHADLPDRPRERVSVANNARMANIWPHNSALCTSREAVALSTRYEMVSVLLAELAALQFKIEARTKTKPKRRAR